MDDFAKRVVVVDARPTDAAPLRELLVGLRERYRVHVFHDGAVAAEAMAKGHAVAILIHAGLEARPGLPAAGPLVAALCRNKRPDQPMVLYTGNPSARLERQAAQLGLPVPVIHDRRLQLDPMRVVDDLIRRHDAERQLTACAQARDAVAPTSLPGGFRIDSWLEQVESAHACATVREHPDWTRAAWAAGVPVETLRRLLRHHELEVPRGSRPGSIRTRRLLWCSNRPAPTEVADACAAADLAVREVAPGFVSPAGVLSVATTAALVEIVDARSVFDAWLVERCLKPCHRFGLPSVPLRLLLESFRLTSAAVELRTDAIEVLLDAGDRTSRLYQDNPLHERLAYCRSGLAAWPLHRDALLHAVDQRVLHHARETEGSNAAAARAVGLEIRTFQRRLGHGSVTDIFDSQR